MMSTCANSIYLRLVVLLAMAGGTAAVTLAAETPAKAGVAETDTPGPRLKRQWSGCDSCAQPESVYFNSANQNLYVSNIGGEPDKKDGTGSIQKLNQNGKMLSATFVTGLNAPKGIRARAGKLYVADIDELLVINEKSGKIEKRIPVPGAKFLNDVAIDAKGTVYISDTVGSSIYTWSAKKGLKTLASGKFLECPNGLYVDGNLLFIAAWGVMNPDWSTEVAGRVMQLDLKSMEIKVITEAPLGNLDGIEKIDADHFLVSDYVGGKVYSVSRKGEVEELLSGTKGAADLGWNPAKRQLLLPRMEDNVISAYTLK